jgi:hypothetical protein
MSAQRMKKKRALCKKKPVGVGQPPSDATSIHPPKNFWKSLYVSGFATRKKTRVVYAAYLALSAILGDECLVSDIYCGPLFGLGTQSSLPSLPSFSLKHTIYRNRIAPMGIPSSSNTDLSSIVNVISSSMTP